MEVLDNLLYSKEHEWIQVDGENGTIGITDHAQEELGDVVFVDLPKIGEVFAATQVLANLESVKAVSEVYCPVGGEILKINNNLEDSPELINSSPYGEGWFFKIKPSDLNELESLLSPEEYSTNCED